MTLLCRYLLVLLLLAVAGTHGSALLQDERDNLPRNKYVLVLDDSHLGTYLHLHNFSISPSREPAFVSTTLLRGPHFSAYTQEQLVDSAETLWSLLETASELIPAKQHAETLLVFCVSEALARFDELRLWPMTERPIPAMEALLNDKAGAQFKLAHNEAQVVSQTDMAKYNWVGMNHLLEELSPGHPGNVAIISLSHLESRITFLPDFERSAPRLRAMASDRPQPPTRLRRPHAASYPILFHKVLPRTGFATISQQIHKSLVRDHLMAETILLQEETFHKETDDIVPIANPVVPNPCISRHEDVDVVLKEDVLLRLRMPAVDPAERASDPVGTYTMSGRGVGDFAACSELVDQHLDSQLTSLLYGPSLKPEIPPIPSSSLILLTGAFADIIEPALFSPKEDILHATTVDKIADLARILCLGGVGLNPSPVWCLELTIVHRLLVTAYGLDGSREVMFGKRLDGVGTMDWTLGFALQAIMDERNEISVEETVLMGEEVVEPTFKLLGQERRLCIGSYRSHKCFGEVV
ncbi:hypothetical protein HMN09_01172400 [Mycena chlorophos]|uniref:guanosine-diphosphatase n=1 Tax=Mycena chlorophos TaxID=658473 RepID=A0A8H6S7Y3_MYCCL|nr:hypothetical protein HMN09_01172400 [Mycena chlorophos]